MKIGLCFPYWNDREPPSRELFLTWCRLVDQGPFSSLSCGERINGPSVEMSASLAAAAALTERVRIVPTLYVMPLHQPVWVAKHAATLDVISGGRVTVTVGVGGGVKDKLALGSQVARPQAHMEQGVEIMRRVWRGEAPFEGTIPVGPAPVQEGGPPILAGVMRPRAVQRAARWADGVYSWSGNGEAREIAPQLELVRKSWLEAGRAETPRLVAGFWFSLGGDAERRVKEFVQGYVGLHDAKLARKMAERMTRFTPDAVSAALDAYQELGVDECMLNPCSRDPIEVERLAEIVTKRG
ncbi:MAG: LLM class flavin-dependent oxidoreductase [Myxococcota bacterium]|nr:LLM class flavin-dependent oxidoreductase [Myxococcota bacterium]